MSASHKIKTWDAYNDEPLVNGGSQHDSGFHVVETPADYIDFEDTKIFKNAFPGGEIDLIQNSFSQTRETDI